MRCKEKANFTEILCSMLPFLLQLDSFLSWGGIAKCWRCPVLLYLPLTGEIKTDTWEQAQDGMKLHGLEPEDQVVIGVNSPSKTTPKQDNPLCQHTLSLYCLSESSLSVKDVVGGCSVPWEKMVGCLNVSGVGHL